MPIRYKLGFAVIFILLTCVVLGALALGEGMSDSPENSARTRAYAGRAIENGAELYNRLCARCHGARGEGVTSVAPMLKRQDLFDGRRARELQWNGSTETFLQATLRAGRPVPSRPDLYSARMPAWDREFGGTLSSSQIDNLVAFLSAWQSDAPEVNVWLVPMSPRTPTAFGSTPQAGLARVCRDLSAPYAGKQSPYAMNDAKILAQGKKIYEDKCAACHGATGKGDGPAAAVLNPKPANLTDKNFMQTLPIDCHFFAIAEGVRGTAMPPWKSLGEDIVWQVLIYTRSFSGVP